MTTWGQLKTKLRQILWPDMEAENLVAAHDQSFLTAMVDLQTWVPCLQQDNTSIFPHCSTFFHCGMTVFPAPRGNIFSVSVVDRINEDTGLEDATAEIQWCSEVPYSKIDYCHVRDYINRSNQSRFCYPFALFFGLPWADCTKGYYPAPTGEGLAEGLPNLPLGYIYAQTSTDAAKRAQAGCWAMERGKIYLGPWIQSTESVVVKWDGIKREWNDADPVEVDPMLEEALMAWVDSEHRRRWEQDAEAAPTPDLDPAYQSARQRLIHQCREETRQRACSEVSHARSSPGSLTALYFNDEQRYTAECPDGTDGADVTQVIMAGTIGSSVSKEDANAKAREEAVTQAEARLVCDTADAEYWNDAQTYTAECATDEEHPPVEGASVTVTIPADTVSSSVSKAAANAAALADAVEQAESQRDCTWWNKETTYTAECPGGSTGDDVEKTVAAHTYSSNISQEDADQQAVNAAKLEAEEELVCDSGGGGTSVAFYNTQQEVTIARSCPMRSGSLFGGYSYTQCSFTVTVTAQAGHYSDTESVTGANNYARNQALAQATSLANNRCALLAVGAAACGDITSAI